MTFESLMGRGRDGGGIATVRTAAPPGASPQPDTQVGIINEAQNQVGMVMEGRLTLIALNSLVVMLILFYLWTRRSQGGG
jgi:hypothetical protein